MKKAAKNDKKTVTDILTESFDSNLSVNSVVKQDKKRVKRIHALMAYVFDVGIRIGQVYLSDDEKAAVICNFPDENKAAFFDDLKLAFRAVSIERVLAVLKREQYIKSKHPQTKFIHLWFIGTKTENQGQGYGSLLMKELLSLKAYKKYPICLETSNKRNLPFYERFGFCIYHTWENADYPLWFMKRDPKEE